MKLLLDTHLLIWAMDAPHRLSKQATGLLESTENQLLFSLASIWEIAIKFALKKPSFDTEPEMFQQILLDNGFGRLNIESDHVIGVRDLPHIHRDPFDRLLIAQANAESITLLTLDANIARYDGSVIHV